MGSWGYSKRKSRHYPKRPKRGLSSDDFPDDPRKNLIRSSPFDDERRRRELEEFARRTSQELEKRKEENRKKEKQEKFDRVINLKLGHAKGFLIKATPVLVQLDPTLSAIYTSWKAGKYGYCFLKQVEEDYKRSGNFEESLKTVAMQEVEKKIVSRIKSIPIEKPFQYAANRIWTLCKESFSDSKIDPKWDKFAENALAKSFEEVGGHFL